MACPSLEEIVSLDWELSDKESCDLNYTKVDLLSVSWEGVDHNSNVIDSHCSD